MEKVCLIDDTLRDGMHAVHEQLTAAQMAQIAGLLDQSGIFGLEFGHGMGLGAQNSKYGPAADSDEAYLTAVLPIMRHARSIALYLPQVGQEADLKKALDKGVDIVRVAIPAGEAQLAAAALAQIKQHGKMAVGFMMMASTCSAAILAQEAGRLLAYGADIVYITDSAGAMLPHEVKDAVLAIRQAHPLAKIGFHGHNNLGLAITNSLTAIEAGAVYIDCTLRGLGAGAGNAPTEILALLLRRMGSNESLDWERLLQLAEMFIDPLLTAPPALTNEMIRIGAQGTVGNAVYVAGKIEVKEQSLAVFARDCSFRGYGDEQRL